MQRSLAVCGLDIDIASYASVAAIGRAVGKEGFSLEGDAAVAAAAGIDCQLGFISEAWRCIVVWCGIQSRLG
jgi:hypothetical protein